MLASGESSFCRYFRREHEYEFEDEFEVLPVSG